MNRRFFAVLGLLAGLAAAPAPAAQLPNGVTVSNAGDLEFQCVNAVVLAETKNRKFTEDQRLAAQYCAGYFSSLNDMLMAMRDGGVNPMGICYPATPQPPVVAIRVFIQFVNRHDDSRRSLAMPVALAALAEAFPCNGVISK